MEPNKQPAHSIDYLDQIAAPPQKPAIKDKLFPIIVFGGLILALLVGAFLLFGPGAGSSANAPRLAARLKTLQSIADSSQGRVKNTELRSINTNLSLFLTNTSRDLAAPFLATGVDVAKLDSNVIASENGSGLKSKLEEARLNAMFDRTYAREIAFQIETLSALMQQVENDTNNRELKQRLATARTQLQPLIQQFSNYTAASS